jgi:hypothetical protein
MRAIQELLHPGHAAIGARIAGHGS